jgi:UDP-N-acetylglucosamine diphosphorylase/glucosamine-1-phosphate N-acetyltransferase
MVEIQFFEDEKCGAFYPLNAMRSVADLPWGGRGLREVWAGQIRQHAAFPPGGTWVLNSRWVPGSEAVAVLAELGEGERWERGGTVLARRGSGERARAFPGEPDLLGHVTDLFVRCGEAIEAQLEGLCAAWEAEPAREWPVHCTVIGPADRLRLAPGVRLLASTLNTEGGPIVLGPGVEVQEGSHLRGPLALGPGTQVKMGTRIQGPTTAGTGCRLGGEISNSILLDHSNKGHDGFLGNSVIGSWCNLGADTNTSNLRNNYRPVPLWNADLQTLQPSPLLFVGLLMGDHAKCGINTMFNTGTSVGFGAQYAGAGFPPKHLPPFTWGAGGTWQTHDIERFIDTARAVMARRQMTPTSAEEAAWRRLHAATAPDRDRFLHAEPE